MKKIIIIVSLLFGAILLSTKSKADSDVFLNLGIGVGLPAPVFVAPPPVIYSAPTFASASLISEISPNTFLSFSIGVPAPVFVAPVPLVLVPPVFTYPSVVVESAPAIVYPAPVIFHSGPRHIKIHNNIHINSHGGPPGLYKHKYRGHSYGRPPGHHKFKVKPKHVHR